ncbi:MAG: MgtC/SapB family protein [Lachnospiraceae bacterium]|nr:MgtC/SapB family protein [Lachnospiraceae bacterium]
MGFIEYIDSTVWLSTIVRIVISLICGGIIGMEREKKKRPAGFRTYMLVCMGATLVMMTNEFLTQNYETGDPARMGAQVISGIGFLGAGTIIVTGRNRVRGLTTAAGLWASACVGLAIGVGYYLGGLVTTVAIVGVMSFLHLIDDKMTAKSRVVNTYIEVDNSSAVGKMISYLKHHDVRIYDIEITRPTNGDDAVIVLATLKVLNKRSHNEVLHEIEALPGVRVVEEA